LLNFGVWELGFGEVFLLLSLDGFIYCGFILFGILHLGSFSYIVLFNSFFQ